MSMVFSEEQQMLQTSAAEFFSSELSIEQFRGARDQSARNQSKPENNRVVTVDSVKWQTMVELGWSAIMVAEQFGGLGFGVQGLGAISIEAGKHLAATHTLNTSALGVVALQACDSSERHGGLRDELLAGIVDGSVITAFATAGSTEFVAEASTATHLLVTDGNVLNVYDLSQAQLEVSRGCLDSRDYVSVDIEPLKSSAELNLPNGDAEVLQVATVLTAAEQFGISEETFNQTLAYLKEREQFGQKIGSFQALQHRMATAYTELQMLKSVLLDALDAVGEKREDSALAVSHAKLMANEVSSLICTEAIQMHGGMGITDELDIGLFYKRARVLKTQYGSSAFHKQQCAALLGF